MIAIIVAAACVFLVALAAWSRRSAARAERRSVREYGKTLGVLADVSKRSERATARPELDDDVARPHVHQSEASETMRPASNARVDVPPPRLRLHPPSVPNADEKVPASGSGAAEHEDPAPIVFDDALPVETLPAKPRRDIRGLRIGRDYALRRAATGAAAAVVIGALAIGGYELVANRAPTAGNSHDVTGTSGSHASTSTTTSLPPTQSRPPASTAPGTSGLEPTSRSTSLVAFAAPTGAYTVTFATSSAGACWVGVQTSAQGSFVWQDTLTASSTVTYHADGPVVVRIGNPQALRVLVNGEHVDLPAKNVLAYDIALTPAGQTSA